VTKSLFAPVANSRRAAAPEAVAITIALLALLIATQGAARLLLRSILPDRTQLVGEAVAEIIGFVAMLCGLGLWLRWRSGRSLSSLGFEREGAARSSLRGALAAVAMVAATAGLVVTTGATFAPGTVQSVGVTALGVGLFLLLVNIVQASAEEALFRGWLLQALGARYGPWVGVVLSSLLFSLAHALGTGFAPLAALNLFLFGVFASLYAWRAGGLWGVCVWHALWNWAHGRLLGFTVSGSAAEAGLLTSIAPTGPEAITGGRFGPEGGLAATFVFLLAIGILIVAPRRDRSP
jgi:CAAX protease family protein